eukprot:m.200909 g.200909  ORF g.200909 m.200909 type:complete len:864 (-) comp32782_c0_seq1:202-2793(-)
MTGFVAMVRVGLSLMVLVNTVVAITASKVTCDPAQYLNDTVIANGHNLRVIEKAKSPGDCCYFCSQNAECGAWSYHTFATGDAHCTLHPLKSSGTAAKANVTSAYATPTNSSKPNMACQPGRNSSYPFCNSMLSTAVRVADLVKRVADTDKPNLLTARQIQALPDLDVPGYYWGTNCIQSVEVGAHGESGRCVGDKCPTHFPNPPNMMSTFNKTAMGAVANAMAVELRAFYNLHMALGLDCWGPVLNLARDPRWGRNGEAGSEDPYLMSMFSLAYTLGFQNGTFGNEHSTPNEFFRGLVTLKHWDANTLEDSDGFTRHTFDANVSNFVLQDSYFPAFRTAIKQGGARGIMCAYNSVQGVPSCSNSLLVSVLDLWGYQGYTTSDSDAVKDSYSAHKYWTNASQASCKSVVNGRCDINSGNTYSASLLQGVNEGICAIEDVDDALARTFKQRFDLGLFDSADSQPLTKLGVESIATEASSVLSLKAAEESLVLLKNVNKLLPIKSGGKIAVIGPMAADATPMLGTHYKGYTCPDNTLDCVSSPLQAIAKINNASGGSTSYALGSQVKSGTESDRDAAVAIAKDADTIVLMLGIDNSIEHESADRVSIDLPSSQHELTAAIYSLGKPTIVILINGGAVSIEQEMDASMKQLAIVEALLPGARGGEAIANGLFGYHGFGGRLPYSIYPASFVNETAMSEMDPTVAPGRTYRYYNGTFLFPFASGLTLADVGVDWGDSASANAQTIATDGSNTATIVIDVTNKDTIGPSASQVVTAFWSPHAGACVAIPAKKQMFDFDRVEVAPGEKSVVTFHIAASALQTADITTGDLVVLPGTYSLSFTDGGGANLTVMLNAVGEKQTIEKFPVNA